jgi:phosphoribosyl 1,2-cyclic phosphate phosphodiesterase
MLAVTFLGTGTSIGVPVIQCDCLVCQSPDPRDRRFRSAVYLESETASWVIDTGADFRLQALQAGIKRLDAVVYTHSHADHIMGFDDLRRFSSLNGNRMPVYASQQTLNNLKAIFYYAFSGEARFPGYVHPEPHVVEKPFCLGEDTIIPIEVEHGRAHVFGYVVQQNGKSKLAYISDCKSISSEGMAHLTQVDTLVLGTPCRRAHPTHLSMDEGLALSTLIKPKRTFFTHLSHDFGHVATQKALPPDVFLAYDGLRLELE